MRERAWDTSITCREALSFLVTVVAPRMMPPGRGGEGNATAPRGCADGRPWENVFGSRGAFLFSGGRSAPRRIGSAAVAQVFIFLSLFLVFWLFEFWYSILRVEESWFYETTLFSSPVFILVCGS
ncbi:hypothetical protein AVEN_179991-1 [Araneus ventricosus]|uniref:Uncharacterized protein n=1 Tax=Araneus ventricosus TaxID=182803 RepID=A0A4Y2MD51_ARAVE|nr:hypothetical protein AVEN_179991-1 [Araneus ventricosus]